MTDKEITDKDFIKEVFEIAFGPDCMECDIPYPREEVLEKLMEFCENAYKWEEQEPKIPEDLDEEFMNWYNRGYENGLKEGKNA